MHLREATNTEAWDAQVELSPQGTVFCKTAFLQSLGVQHRLWLVEHHQRAVALVPVIEDAQGNGVRFAFTPYQGILFLHDRGAQLRQTVVDEFRITEFVIEEFTRRYPQIEWALSWNFKDIRPFLWHNYGHPNAPKFAVEPRYTALLELSQWSQESYPGAVRACRRQELKKAAAHRVQASTDLEQFLRLYRMTFARQGTEVGEKTLGLVERIADQSIRSGYGRLGSCETSQGIAAMSLFLYDSKRAYYLFAANDPTQRQTGAATRLMFDQINETRRRGLGEVDFVGVNSPNRGDFKLSFCPELKLYFHLTLRALDDAHQIHFPP